MEENEVLNNVGTEGGDGVSKDTTTKTENTDTVTMSKADYDKAIQSAEDKVRGKLSKEIKDLQEKVKELSPVEKTPEQIVLEERIARLEASEKALADKEKRLGVQETLAASGIDKGLVDFLKDDVDVDALSNIIEAMVKGRMKSNSYIPANHDSDDKVSVDDFKKMKYSEKEKLMKDSPELYKRLMSAIKR